MTLRKPEEEGRQVSRKAWRGLQGQAPRGSAQPPGQPPPTPPTSLPRFPQTHRHETPCVQSVDVSSAAFFWSRSPQSSHRVRSWRSPSLSTCGFLQVSDHWLTRPSFPQGVHPLTPMLQSAESLSFHH